jgi:hypothetical protein
MPRVHAVAAMRCSAVAKSTGETCRRWSLVGSTVCVKHGAAAGQVRRSARVRLTVQELSSIDPRPIKVVLADAVHLADITMQDYAQSSCRRTPLASGWAKMVRTAAATMSACRLGRANRVRPKWIRQRCQLAASRVEATAVSARCARRR